MFVILCKWWRCHNPSNVPFRCERVGARVQGLQWEWPRTYDKVNLGKFTSIRRWSVVTRTCLSYSNMIHRGKSSSRFATAMKFGSWKWKVAATVKNHAMWPAPIAVWSSRFPMSFSSSSSSSSSSARSGTILKNETSSRKIKKQPPSLTPVVWRRTTWDHHSYARDCLLQRRTKICAKPRQMHTHNLFSVYVFNLTSFVISCFNQTKFLHRWHTQNLWSTQRKKPTKHAKRKRERIYGALREETHETRKEEERTNTCATSQGTCLRCRRRPRRKRRPHLRPHPRRLHRPLPRPLSCEIFTVVNAAISTRVQSLFVFTLSPFRPKVI